MKSKSNIEYSSLYIRGLTSEERIQLNIFCATINRTKEWVISDVIRKALYQNRIRGHWRTKDKN
jgi:hypothetical protein